MPVNSRQYIAGEKTKTDSDCLWLYGVSAELAIRDRAEHGGQATLGPADAWMLATIFARKIDNSSSATLITVVANLIAQTIGG